MLYCSIWSSVPFVNKAGGSIVPTGCCGPYIPRDNSADICGIVVLSCCLHSFLCKSSTVSILSTSVERCSLIRPHWNLLSSAPHHCLRVSQITPKNQRKKRWARVHPFVSATCDLWKEFVSLLLQTGVNYSNWILLNLRALLSWVIFFQGEECRDQMFPDDFIK